MLNLDAQVYQSEADLVFRRMPPAYRHESIKDDLRINTNTNK